MRALNWCEIYVDGKISCERLAGEVISITDAGIQFTDGMSRWELDMPAASLSVERNDEHHPFHKRGDDGFLHFPLVITSEQKPSARKQDYELLIVRIAQHIQQLGLRREVIADFDIEQ